MPQELGFVDERSADHYEALGANVGYINNTGLLAVPIASDVPDAACAVVRTHAPLGFREVNYSAECIGAWPKAPAPPPPNEYEYLLYVVRRPRLPLVRAEGTAAKYAIDYTAVYAQLTPTPLNASLATGSLPNSATPKAVNDMPAERFTGDIIGDPVPVVAPKGIR